MSDSNEFIDNAIDEAYALADEKAEVTKEAESAEIVESKEVPEVEAKEASTAKLTPEAEEQTPVSDKLANEETVEAESEPPIQMPTFWSAELKAIAAKSSPELLKAYIQHEQQREQYVNRIANENQRGKEFERQMYADLGNDPAKVEAHRASLRLNGIRNEIEELHRYRAWDTVFKADAPTAITDLMRKNNLTPEQIYETFYNGNSDYSQQQEDPKNSEVEAIRNEFQAYKEQQETAVITNEINAFKSGKDADGNDRKQFVEAYAPQIDQAITQIRQSYPHFTLSQALGYAYDHVMAQVKQLHGLNTPKPIAKPSVDVKKAQSASSGMSGAPVAGTVSQRSRLNGKTFDEKLDNAVDIAMSQAGI